MATYWVATTGSDSNPGTELLPFLTIQKGANTADTAGDIVIVKDGTYTYSGADGGHLVDPPNSGSVGSTITIKAENYLGAILDGNNNGVEGAGAFSAFIIDGEGQSYLQIEGFEIRNFDIASFWITYYDTVPPHHVIMKRNKIHGIGRYASESPYGLGHALFCKHQVHHLTFDSNICYTLGRTGSVAIERNHDHALYLQGLDQTAINNIFYDIMWGWACHIVTDNDSNDGRRVQVINNTFADANPGREAHIYISRAAQIEDLVIANNVSYNPNTCMIYWWGGADAISGVICNNITNSDTLEAGSAGIPDSPPITRSNNLVSTDPLFVNAAGRNYQLSASSPAIGHASATYAPAYDLLEVVRPQGVGSDTGAYEYPIGGESVATYVKFQDFVEQLGKGVHQLHAAGHTLMVYLTNNTPSVSADAVKADLVGITEQFGYAAADIQNDLSESGGTLTVTAQDKTWTATGGSFGPFRYAVIYNDTPTSPADPLVCYYDYGSEVTVNTGETFMVNFGASLFTLT